MFQKSAGVKKYPTTQSRAVNTVYSFDVEANTTPSQMMQAAAENYPFPVGRNHMGNPDQLAECTRMLRGGGASTTVILPFQSQMNYPGGFTISGLNLNLGAGGATTLAPPQQDVSCSMNMVASGSDFGAESAAGYSADQIHNSNGAGNRYMSIGHCMDLDSYWPPY